MQKQQDIATLSKEIVALRDQLTSLIAQNEALAKQNLELSDDLEKAHETIGTLLEQIKLLQLRHFGSKSERVVADQLSLFNEMEASSDEQVQEPKLRDESRRKPRRRGGKRVLDLSKFETVVIEHELPADERTCKVCGTTLVEMGIEITRRVRLVPAHLVVEEHRRHVYKCPSCCEQNATDGSVNAQLVRAKLPRGPIKNSFATASLLSYILHAKYANSLPLYRLEQDFKTLGAPISRANMANWTLSVWEAWLSLIYERLKIELYSHDLMHADETKVQVLKEPGREASKLSYMWLFCSAACDRPVFIYSYHPSRAKSVPEEFLAGWKGTLTTDGYKPYFSLANKDITNTACLVHVRRKFQEIVRVAGGDEKAEKAHSVALVARRKIDEVFALDKSFETMDANSRYAARKEKLEPLMRSFEVWVQKMYAEASPRLALYNALQYALWCWPYVMQVLSDGRLVLDNNRAERAIKPFVIGRKNWLFSDTPKGAEASCGIYSIVTTAKMCGVNPRAYLEWLLTELPNSDDLSDAYLDSLLPWSDKVPDSCKLSTHAAKAAAAMKDDPIIDIDPELLEKDT